MDKKNYEANRTLWITKHIMKLGGRYVKKTYYEARWTVWITKYIMKLGEVYG